MNIESLVIAFTEAVLDIRDKYVMSQTGEFTERSKKKFLQERKAANAPVKEKMKPKDGTLGYMQDPDQAKGCGSQHRKIS